MNRRFRRLRLMLFSIIFCTALLFLMIGAEYKVYGGELKSTEIGNVDSVKRLIQGNDTIHLIRIDDPDNPFISIYFTTIDSGKVFALADPSNTSIAVRLTGKIPLDKNGKMKINTTPREDMASISKSIGTKEMKIARFYDKQKNVLCYLVYTTKWIDGSLKHNISVVPLGIPLVPQ